VRAAFIFTFAWTTVFFVVFPAVTIILAAIEVAVTKTVVGIVFPVIAVILTTIN